MYALLALSVVFASLNSAVLHKSKISGRGAVWKYNLISATVWCAVLFFACGCAFPKSAGAWIWGCVYGITQALFILFKTEAMNSGPVAITTLVGNSSLVVSIAVCFLLWNELMTLADGVGVACLLFGIFLISFGKGGGFSKRWPFFTVAFLIFASAVGVVFKAFSKMSTAAAGEMMLAAAIVMLGVYFVAFLLTGGAPKSGTPSRERIEFVLLALVSGLLSCLYNRFNVYLSGALDAVVFFPAFNGGVTLLSACLGVVLLGEKLSKRQIFGILVGVCGICIVGIF